MEIFEVQYKGKQINAIKTDKGIYVKLPKIYGEKGTEIQESISKDSKGWKFSSSVISNPEYGFDLWIRNDGKLGYHSHTNDRIYVTPEVFEPNLKNGGKLNNIAIEVFNLVEQLEKYERCDIPVTATCALRREKLKTALTLLGYSSIDEINSELDDSNGYVALTRIGKQLKEYINLGAYVHIEGKHNDEDIIRVDIPKGMTREDFIRLAIPVTDEYASDKDFIGKREQKRDILVDYCAEMSKKIPYMDWLAYSKVVRETAQLFLELNADLLSEQDRGLVSDSSQLTGTLLEDRISKLIDSKEFATACDIENRFSVREGQRLIKQLDTKLQETDDTMESIKESLEELREEETTIIAEKSTYKSERDEDGISIDD